VALWQAYVANDLTAMRAVSDRLYPIVRGIYGAPPLMDMHTRIKAGLVEKGVIAHGAPRAPLAPLTVTVDATMRKMAQSVADAPI
jgi:4-hydroxy-tetrahydrodipicolinate synthase